MTNADVLEFNLGVMLRESLIWVETLHSTFVSLTACMKVSVLESSLRQRSDIIILYTFAEWHMSQEHYKLLCH